MFCSWTHSRCSFRRAYSPVPSWTRKLLTSCGGGGGGGGAAAGLRDEGGVTAVLQYQRPPVPGERVGRVINGAGDEAPAAEQQILTDVHVPATVHVSDARRLVPQPTLDSRGFELRRWGAPTAATAAHLADEQLARRVFYPEAGLALQLYTGCGRTGGT